MKFDLRKPCANCPFLTEPEFYLSRERREGIASSLEDTAPFPCHKTIQFDEDDEYEPRTDEQFCAGAMITMIKDNHAWINNGFLRVVQRLNAFDPDDYDLSAPTHNDLDEFRRGPTGQRDH